MVEVVAALIREGECFLICQRPSHKARGLLWEFVGGKVEPGETPTEALVRECREELDIAIEVGEVFLQVVHAYPDITVRLTLFWASIAEGVPKLLEHNAIAWITPSEIPNYDFCPADREILEKIRREWDAHVERAALIRHYDALIDADNDPARDPAPLRAYMDKWDGEDFLKLLALRRDASVLEIGVGSGRLALRVAPLCGAFCGIDLSPKTVARAEENLRAHPHVRLVCDDFLMHDFGSERFDRIYSSLTFLHIRRKREAVEKIFSLLKPAGRFVLSVDKSQATELDAGAGAIRIYPDTPESIRRLLRAVGFCEICESETEHAFLFAAERA